MFAFSERMCKSEKMHKRESVSVERYTFSKKDYNRKWDIIIIIKIYREASKDASVLTDR